MLKKLFCALLVTVPIITKSQVVPNIDWTKYYGNTSTPSLSSISNAIDAVNSTYVTGYIQGSTKDLVVIKYDSLGNQRWVYTYNNGGDDVGNAITLKGSYVYITGKSYGTATTLDDIITIKLDTAGSQQWAKRFNLGTGPDEGRDIKVDASGNVYTAGTAYKGGTRLNDIEVVKYLATGTQTWATNWDGAGKNDVGIGLVLSSNGNSVYVAGNKEIATGVNDIAVLALKAASGGTVWTYTVNGTANSNDEAYGIILSGANIAVCGKLNNSGTGEDYTTIKLKGSNGDTLFKRDYDFGTNTNYATALVRDSTGNIAVVGKAFNGTYYEYHTLLYDSTGTKLWTNPNVESTLLGSANILPKIVCDTIAHHFYVSGEIMRSNADGYVYQVSPTGNTKWKQYINGQGNGTDGAISLNVNGLGEIHVAAITTNTGSGYDITTVKISQTPDYSPVDTLNEKPNDNYIYTTNQGQLLDESGNLVTSIDYYTEYSYPKYFFKGNQMSFIYAHYDTLTATNDTTHKVNMNFFHSNPLSVIYPQDEASFRSNYFIPQVPAGVTDVKNYHRLFIPNIYPYVDVHYYSNANGLKYYLVVKPGQSPNIIKQQFEGASSTTVSGTNLVANTILGTLTLQQPYAYQVAYVGGTYSIVPVSWTPTWTSVGTDIYGISTGTYNLALPLVFEIDQGNSAVAAAPQGNLNWNTYAGGDYDEAFYDMDLDKQGTMYTVEKTNSSYFFTAPTFSNTQAMAATDGLLLYKFNKYGIKMAQTYIGSSGGIAPNALTVLSDSSVVIVGSKAWTTPTVTNPPGSYTNTTGQSYILKFASNLQTLQWSTRYPGSLSDVDANSANDIYVIGNSCRTCTDSPYLLTKPNAVNIGTANIAGSYCDVVTRFKQNGAPNWSSFIPNAAALSLKVDKKRDCYYVIGYLNDTTDFKHFNKYNTFLQNTLGSFKDAVIQKFTSADTIIVSTLYGGNKDDNFKGIDIKKNGDVMVVGDTQSTDSTAISYNPADGSYYNFTTLTSGGTAGLIVRFDSTMQRKWAINYGNTSNFTSFTSICYDTDKNIFIGGYSDGMPLLGLTGAYNNSSAFDNSGILLFDSLQKRKWVTYMGATFYTGCGIGTVKFNPTNNNYWFSGNSATQGWGNYPFVDAIPGITYYQPQLWGSIYFSDGIIGRFSIPSFVTGIDEKSKNDMVGSIRIYPNPSSSSFFVSLDKQLTKPFTMSVYNLAGQLVLSKLVSDPSLALYEVNLSGFTNGLYIIKVLSSELNGSVRVIKE